MPSGRWQASHMHNGKRITGPGTFPTKTDANAWLDDQGTDIRRGTWIDPKAGQLPFLKYSEGWMASWPGLGELSTELYAYLLRKHINPAFGHLALNEITPTDVREWFTPLSERIPVAAAKAYRLLNQILKTAVADELILKNPCRIPGASSEPHSERPTVSLEELGVMVDSFPEKLRVIPLLAVWCQLRKAEIMGLRRQDIDLLHGIVMIRQTRTETIKRKEVLKPPKSVAGIRDLSIPPNILGALTDHLERFVGPEPGSLIVTGRDGEPLTFGSVDYHLGKARRAIGRPEVTLHDLRHTGLTWAAATGATTKELMKRGGHASPTAALRYQHAVQDRDVVLAQAMAKMAEVVPMPREGRATPESVGESTAQKGG